MRVLMVSQVLPYLPCHDGFRVIPANILKHLGARHEIHLLAAVAGSETAEQLGWANGCCASVTTVPAEPPRGIGGRLALFARGISPGLADAANRRMENLRPEVLHLEGPGVAPLARHAPSGIRRVLSAHDSLSLRYADFARFARSGRERLSFHWQAWLGQRLEKRWYGDMHQVAITSPADKESLEGFLPAGRITVIPNGIDLDQYHCRPRPEAGRIVFTGNMCWPPNEDAAEWFAGEILPLVRERAPEAEFWIVGATPSPRVRKLASIPGVTVTGTVPDLKEYISRASVYVSPLRFGAGVKNKILEAMALGTPIVATPPSLTGTPLEDGKHLLIANEPARIADAVARLLSGPALRQRLSQNSRHEIEKAYSWAAIASRFEQVWMG